MYVCMYMIVTITYYCNIYYWYIVKITFININYVWIRYLTLTKALLFKWSCYVIWRQMFVYLSLSLPGQWEQEENAGLRKHGLGLVVFCIWCVPWKMNMCWRIGSAVVFKGDCPEGCESMNEAIHQCSHHGVSTENGKRIISECTVRGGQSLGMSGRERTEWSFPLLLFSPSLPPFPSLSFSLPLSLLWKEHRSAFFLTWKLPLLWYQIPIGSKRWRQRTVDWHLVLRSWIKGIFYSSKL